MKQSTLNKLTVDSTFYDSGLFKYFVSKVYKDKNGVVNGVQAVYSWKNAYGEFCKTTYLSRKELLSKEYNDEFVEIEDREL